MNEALAEAPLEIPPYQEAHERETFHVTDEKTADWVLSKIANCEAELKRAEEWFADLQKRVTNEKEHLVARFGPELEAFAQKQLADGKRKSLKLPNGTLGYRKQPDAVVINEPDELLAWAAKNCREVVPSTIVIDVTDCAEFTRKKLLSELEGRALTAHLTSDIKKSKLNEFVKQTGEVPDGCDFVHGEEKFYIK